MLRVVGGEARGRRLKGAVSPTTRATTERVRAAIFNILRPPQLEGARVLDLFAGSGSLGLEALSRGAAWADFVERDRRQCAVIEENLAATGFADRGRVYRRDVVRTLGLLSTGYGLVLLDPPYRMEGIDRVMEAIACQQCLVAEDGVVVAGHSRLRTLQEEYGPLQRTSHREYGDNVIDFYLMRNSGVASSGIW